MDSVWDTLAGGFPHSEISGSMRHCPLPGAFRRLSRLSSPVVAKASTVCACSLDPITRTPVVFHTVAIAYPVRITKFNDQKSDDADADAVGPRTLPHFPRAIARVSLRTFQIVKEQVRLGFPSTVGPSRNRKPSHFDGFGFPFGSAGSTGRGGGARRVRTADPRLAKPMLSRLSYGPTSTGGPGWTRTTDLTLIRGAL